MIKIVFFDIDGTLISRTTHRVAESTLAALAELRAKGIKVCVATGRAKSTIPDEFLDLFDVIISLNGMYVYDRERVFISHTLDPEDVKILVDFAIKNTVPVYFIYEDRHSVNYIDEQILEECETHDIPLPKVEDPRRALSEPIYSASLFLTLEEELALMAQTKTLEGTRWAEAFFDVVIRGFGKHSALLEICEMYGIDPLDSMAFGDGGNDLSMIKQAGIGVAMGNALDYLKAEADYVTDDEDHDGIANALRHFGLIG